MVKIVLVLFLGVFIISCGSKETGSEKETLHKSKISELKIHFTKLMKEGDSTYILDSFRLVRIETLTEREKFNAKRVEIIDEIERKKELREAVIENIKNAIKVANSAQKMLPSLSKNYNEIAENHAKEANDLNDNIQNLYNQHDSLLAFSLKCDSIKPIGYAAVSVVQIRKKDMSVVRDTSYILLNLDKISFYQKRSLKINGNMFQSKEKQLL